MQPLMPYFLGREAPPAPLLTTVQKCFRTPDIDEVGLDGSHLTFFEMLGNFSFGQYFKEGAIDLAWEFVFEHLKIEPERFWVTVFAGDPELGLGEDVVADDHWLRGGMPPERIVFLPARRTSGPSEARARAAPTTEMYYDWGEEHGCGEADCKPELHALRALPRILESRLHGVRAARGRQADSAAEAERRHGHGPRADRCDPAERDDGL